MWKYEKINETLSELSACVLQGFIRSPFVRFQNYQFLKSLKRCTAKAIEEFGWIVFNKGCPVCKALCCCACKTMECPRKYHCYKKCLISRSNLVSLSKKGYYDSKRPKISDSLAKLNLITASPTLISSAPPSEGTFTPLKISISANTEQRTLEAYMPKSSFPKVFKNSRTLTPSVVPYTPPIKMPPLKSFNPYDVPHVGASHHDRVKRRKRTTSENGLLLRSQAVFSSLCGPCFYHPSIECMKKIPSISKLTDWFSHLPPSDRFISSFSSDPYHPLTWRFAFLSEDRDHQHSGSENLLFSSQASFGDPTSTNPFVHSYDSEQKESTNRSTNLQSTLEQSHLPRLHSNSIESYPSQIKNIEIIKQQDREEILQDEREVWDASSAPLWGNFLALDPPSEEIFDSSFLQEEKGENVDERISENGSFQI